MSKKSRDRRARNRELARGRKRWLAEERERSRKLFSGKRAVLYLNGIAIGGCDQINVSTEPLFEPFVLGRF